MPRRLIALLAAGSLAALAGCVYVPPVTQGNYLQLRNLRQLKVGMTRKQVQYLFGEPMLTDPFYPHTWRYVYYYKPGARSKPRIYRLAVRFQDGKVASFQTSKPISQAPGAAMARKKTGAPPSATAHAFARPVRARAPGTAERVRRAQTGSSGSGR
jgi:outer membrane protein assembly factor BamE